MRPLLALFTLTLALTLAGSAQAFPAFPGAPAFQNWLADHSELDGDVEDASEENPGIPDDGGGIEDVGTPRVPGYPGQEWGGWGDGGILVCIPLCGGEGGQTVWVPKPPTVEPPDARPHGGVWFFMFLSSLGIGFEYVEMPVVNPDMDALAEWVAAGNPEHEFDPCAYAAWKSEQ